MKKLYLYILLLLCIIVIGAFSTITHITDKFYKKYESYDLSIDKVYISKIYDNLKSCDIILFKGYRNPIGNILCDGYYMHAEIIIKYDDFDIKKYKLKHNLYSIEIGFDNPDLHPLPLRIKTCGSNCYIFSLNKEITKAMNKKIIKIIHNKREIYSFFNIKNRIKKLYNWDMPIIHCFQYILYLLDKIGLTNKLLKKYNIRSSVNKVSNIHNEKLNFGYKYSKGAQIIYDLYN